MIPRILGTNIKQHFFEGKAIVILGPRQSGKTTLVNYLLKDYSDQFIVFNGDEPDVREILTNANSTQLKTYIGNKKIVFIDEAQRIKDIGITIKLIVDNFPHIQVIVTGSAPLDLAGEIREPLTGRRYEYYLYPIAYEEMVKYNGRLEEDRMIPHRLIYGYYPEIVTNSEKTEELLRLLSDSYLFKDLFLLDQIKKPPLLIKLIRSLAYQVGSEVSYNELAQTVGSDLKTVEKYIDLMEKAFIIFRLPSLQKNLRNEIKKKIKIYFWDNGILNAVIGNFNDIHIRKDTGKLWENFVIAERKKYLSNHSLYHKSYFWRTTQKQEIDYIEEYDNQYTACEIKWNPRRKPKFPKTFCDNYPLSETKVINPKNLGDWIS
ncbi:MAG: ATP-binding protein [Candidatus Cloacimonetes bacterium]|jgi:predicted AAA+ superfamily ATPase|nr:ATP-binding protein [Candidatus Cloacimonadota bacterium]